MASLDAENRLQQLRYTILLVSSCALAAYATFRLPGYLTDASFLEALIFLQIVAAMLWRFDVRFFPFTILVFLTAGTESPGFHGPAGSARWAVLGAGAGGGLFLYLRRRPFGLGVFHLLAAFAGLAALASALVSSVTEESALKSVSLLLLFVYASFGVRLAVVGRKEDFFAALLRSGEFLVYFSAFLYFGLRIPWFGNPNALGAIMGIFAVPLLLWGVLRAREGFPRRRLAFALGLAWVLLLTSYARAGILAALLPTIFLCVGSRKYKFLLALSAALVLAALAVATLIPRYSTERSPLTAFIFKGEENHDVLGSRKSPWEDTLQSVKAHPWLGTGFGTSDTTGDDTEGFHDPTRTNSAVGAREHGNSYLEIIEWVGILGVVPFAGLLTLLLVGVANVFRRMRTDIALSDPRTLLAAFVAAGLLHAFFEDWLFAPGSYLCILFWAMAFLLQHFLTTREGPRGLRRVSELHTPGVWQPSMQQR